MKRAAEAAVKRVPSGDGCAGQRSSQTQHARKYHPRFSPGTLRNTRRCCGSNSHLDNECTSENCRLCGNRGRCCRCSAAGVWCEQSIKGGVYYCGVLPQTSGCQLDCQIWQLRSSNSNSSTPLPGVSIFLRHRLYRSPLCSGFAATDLGMMTRPFRLSDISDPKCLQLQLGGNCQP